MDRISLDEGFAFGIGAFETIAVENGKPVFLKKHLARLGDALSQLEITDEELLVKFTESEIKKYLKENNSKTEPVSRVLKIMVSPRNVAFSMRQNDYSEQDYKRGAQLITSNIRRNESSPFTYIKSLSCGDNIREKQRVVRLGYDEAVFLNSKGQLAEGAVTNLFFCRQDRVFTPKRSCGLLPGVMREWVLENCPVEEEVIYPEEVEQFDEMFITNSLMGIMPVAKFDKKKFKSKKIAVMLQNYYKKFI